MKTNKKKDIRIKGVKENDASGISVILSTPIVDKKIIKSILLILVMKIKI
tara:strand:+ start:1043 stop:1192 length:150 start_codon:yes stop_codon:yes gene_type:complete